jgi:hypothetical protein
LETGICGALYCPAVFETWVYGNPSVKFETMLAAEQRLGSCP